MKKSVNGLLVGLFLYLSVNLNAQNYLFNQRSAPYSFLNNSTSLNNGLTWDDPAFTVPIGFQFNYFGIQCDTVIISFGLGATVLTSLNSNGMGSFLSPFGCDIIDRGFQFGQGPGQNGSLSNISYQTIGSAGSRIFKLEWKNVGFYADLSQNATNATDFANFQLWFFEGSNTIEFHYGPNSIQSPQLSYDGYPGPDVFLIPSFNFNNYTFGGNWSCLDGPVNMANQQSRTANDTLLFLSGTIADGTIYQFSPLSTNVGEFEDSSEKEIVVFPNPVKERLNIQLLDELIPDWMRIFSSKGETIYRSEVFDPSIDVSSLESGFYFLELGFENTVWRKKIVVQ